MTSDMTSLPVEMWYHILDYLGLEDIGNLVCVNRKMNQLVENEETFEYLAQSQFPPSSLDITLYDKSWKRLLQDGNSKNGIIRRNMSQLCLWKWNGCHGRYQYNAIRCMIWDRYNKTVQVGIEAFGHGNLRAAASTAISKMDPKKERVHMERLIPKMFMPEQGPNTPIPDDSTLRNVMAAQRGFAGGSHDCCLLDFDDSLFQGGCQYYFQYNGYHDKECSDFELTEFMGLDGFHSLQDWFDPRHAECEFLARDQSRLKPSNILEWPLTLPRHIVELHSQGRWGVVRGEPAQ